MGRDEVLLREPCLLDAQTATLFAVVDDLCQRLVFMFQVRPVACPRRGIGVVDLGTIDR